MSDHKITFTEDQEKIVQKALDSRNEYLTNANLPLVDMEQFLQQTLEGGFRCSPSDITSMERDSKMSILLSTMVKVPTSKIPDVIAAADAVSAIVAGGTPK